MFIRGKSILAGNLLLLTLLVIGNSPAVRAQAVSIASVTGRVVDPSGAVVSGAEIKMTAVDTGIVHNAVTNGSGIYTLPTLPIGAYTLQARAPGFQTYVQRGIVLQVNEAAQINVTLTVGQTTQSVEVQANAAMVQAQTNNIAQVIDQRRIVQLPLNGRNPMELITIAGASVNHSDGTNTGSKSFATSESIAIAGGAGDQTNYLLDGGDFNDSFTNVNLPFPFPDALQEFSVETSGLPARDGLHPGGLVSAVTKSGSNQWHGSAFEFLRNYYANALSYFAARQDSLKRNQFGGTLGGKIITNKLFFFGGYQGTRTRQSPSATTAFVPTTAALSGDFSTLESPACQSSGVARVIDDPATGLPLTNDRIDPNRFDPAAVKLATFLPKTTNPCGQVSYGVPVQSNESQYITRVDWTLSSKHSLFGRYLYDDYDLAAFWDPTDILVTTGTGNSQRVQDITLGDTYTITPNLVNAFHFTFSRRRIDRGPNESSINAASLGVHNIYQGTPYFLYLNVSNGGFSIGGGANALGTFNVNSFQEADDVDWLRGKHQIAFGVDILRTQDNQNNHYEDNGQFQFSNIYSNDPLLDFLTGYMDKYEQSMPQQQAYRQTVIGSYVQDTFQATPKLVINAGLRWEPHLYPQDYFARGSTFSQANFAAGIGSRVFTNAPAGMLFYGDKGVPRGFTKDTLDSLSPRLGLVYNPDGEGKTTFRAGAGIMYDSPGTFLTYRVTANNLPYGITDSLANGPYKFSDPWTNVPGGNPFPLPFKPPSNFIFPLGAAQVILPPKIKPVTMYQWMLGMQHQFTTNWLFSMSYIGNESNHMMIGNENNPAIYILGNWTGPGSCGALTISPGLGKPCSSTGNTQNRRRLALANLANGQYYGQQTIADDGNNANYNGMLVSLEHRFAHSYTVLANYTWSKCMQVSPMISLGVGGVIENPFNPKTDYGPCTYDTRNIINITGVVNSNFTFSSSWASRLLDGWQLAPLLRYQSGLPFNVTTGADNSLSGVGLDRPNQIGIDPYVHQGHSNALYQYINASKTSPSFVANPIGTFGDAQHNGLTGPSSFDIDAALSRTFGLTENLKLNTRFEAFNALNHPNFNAPSASIKSSSFGRITGSNAGRILQVAAKLTF